MPSANRASWLCGESLTAEIDGIVLDHGVGEELLAHLVDAGAGLDLLGVAGIILDVLALAHVVDAGKTERGEGMLDGAALRVEHARLQGDVDLCFQERAFTAPCPGPACRAGRPRAGCRGGARLPDTPRRPCRGPGGSGPCRASRWS